jgi:glycosyltransferase involved in cell wall biosynthesis
VQATQNKPLVSIGVPVYNDAPWLRNALDHLLAQDYTNLEIILADDGSIDASREICREYAQRDARIRLFENKHNLGALQNHKLVFDVSAGEYFAWGSGHDYYHSSFVSNLLECLQANPSVVMCFSQSVFVNENGEILRTTKGGLDTRGLLPSERFEKFITHLVGGATANIFYGLYRQEALAQMNLSRKVLGHDITMLGELSLLGEMTQINKVLFYRRKKKAETGEERRERHMRMLVDTRGFRTEKLMPEFSASSQFLSIVESNQLPIFQRQHIFDKIVEFDFNIGKPAIVDEVNYFIPFSRREMDSLEGYPYVRQYRAIQISSALNQAWLLGNNSEDLHLVRSICLSAQGLLAEARAAAREEGKVLRAKKVQRMLKAGRQRTANGLHKLLGDKVWGLLRRILGHK